MSGRPGRLTLDSDWRERSFGVYQGLPYEEVFEGYPAFSLSAVGYAAAKTVPGNGERLLAARERVLGAWNRLREGLDDGETVAGSVTADPSG